MSTETWANRTTRPHQTTSRPGVVAAYPARTFRAAPPPETAPAGRGQPRSTPRGRRGSFRGVLKVEGRESTPLAELGLGAANTGREFESLHPHAVTYRAPVEPTPPEPVPDPPTRPAYPLPAELLARIWEAGRA